MSWTIGPGDLQSTRGDHFFLCLGRALYVATLFEHKCRFVLRSISLVTAIRSDPVLGLMDAIEAAPADKQLARTLDSLMVAVPDLAQTREMWVAAREARNYIAHEAAAFDVLSAREADLSNYVTVLRDHVWALVAADNTISAWVHGIEEPYDSVPHHFILAYPDLVDRWVFDSVWDIVAT